MRHFPLFLVLLIGSLTSCKHPEPDASLSKGDTASAPGYPIAIGQIIKQKCLSCHNADNAPYSGGLRLDTWDYLMAGGGVGPDVIPYHLENSVLLQYINTYDDLGLKLKPTMPINGVPLTHEQVVLFQDWVKNGAPNKDGYVAFSSNADTRQKIYLTMESCDLIGVIDAETKMLMRMIEVGGNPNNGNPEIPHCVRIDHAGRYAYVAFASGAFLQKIDVRTDQIVGALNLNEARRGIVPSDPSWSALSISGDDKELMVTSFRNWGEALIVNTETMQLKKQFSDKDLLYSPHGIVANTAFDTFYVTAQYGNTVYEIISKTGKVNTIAIDGKTANTERDTYDPHEIIMLPGGNTYAITCEHSNEVRVLDAHTNQLLYVIPVGKFPQEFALSNTKPWLFVTCTEDAQNPSPGTKGSIYVIDYHTMSVVKKIYGPFWQPHGIAVDDLNGKVYVASVNEGSGFISHHTTSCDGKNGFYHVIDLESLALLRDTRYEVGVRPYSAAVRFSR